MKFLLVAKTCNNLFRLGRLNSYRSPLDVKGVKADISTREIVSFVRESREA